MNTYILTFEVVNDGKRTVNSNGGICRKTKTHFKNNRPMPLRTFLRKLKVDIQKIDHIGTVTEGKISFKTME